MFGANVSQDTFGEFRVIQSRSGDPTAIHLPSRCLIHSKVDPVKEAREIASAQQHRSSGATVLLGGGLGYLAEAILVTRDANHQVWVIEPDAILHRLGQYHRATSPYHHSPQIRVRLISSVVQLSRSAADIPKDAEWMISPYCLRLERSDQRTLSGWMSMMRAESVSYCMYGALLAEHSRENEGYLKSLPVATVARLTNEKVVCVCGAGPSLSHCLHVLRERRERVEIVCVSGAVPALLSEGVAPDWVIALEARECITRDLSDLPRGAKLILFPATHPEVMERSRLYECYRGDGADGLVTRGGSSLIPSLDFALRTSRGVIALLGADLGHQAGTYASGAQRSVRIESDVSGAPPKFQAMRAGCETLLHDALTRNREIVHVLTKGAALRGTVKISPSEFERVISEEQHCEMIHDR